MLPTTNLPQIDFIKVEQRLNFLKSGKRQDRELDDEALNI